MINEKSDTYGQKKGPSIHESMFTAHKKSFKGKWGTKGYLENLSDKSKAVSKKKKYERRLQKTRTCPGQKKK